MKFRVYVMILVLMLSSCGPKKGIVTKRKRSVSNTETKTSEAKTTKTITKEIALVGSTADYIEAYKTIAMEEMMKYKIPASITLAQGILESGSGRGRLAVEANNHFGIKCHDWTGDKIYHDDDSAQECFRKYQHPESSYEDHSLFLISRSRYASLFELDPDDYIKWAKGLRAAGYATDRRYPEKLISLIERYELHQFDKVVLGDDYSNTTKISSNTKRHVVVKGDTLYSLSKRYNISIDQLMTINNLTNNDLKIGQVLILNSN